MTAWQRIERVIRAVQFDPEDRSTWVNVSLHPDGTYLWSSTRWGATGVRDMPITAGEWIVDDPQLGNQRILKDADFRRIYEPKPPTVEQQVAAALANVAAELKMLRLRTRDS